MAGSVRSRKETLTSTLPTLLTAVVLAVAGQLLVKAGINSVGGESFADGLLRGFLRIYTSPLVLIGTAVYAFSVFFWVYTLTKTDLSLAFPFVSLSYVLVILASWILLGETVPPLRWLGAAVICVGIILVSRS